MFQFLHMNYILSEYLRILGVLVFCLYFPPALSLAVSRDLRHLCILLFVLWVIIVSVEGSNSRFISEEVIFVRVIVPNSPVAVNWELAHVRGSLIPA